MIRTIASPATGSVHHRQATVAMKQPVEEKLLGIAQAARIIGINHVTVGKLVRQGSIRSSRTENGFWVIPESEVVRYAAVLSAEREPK
jgi:hypothetical protein